MPPQPLSSKKPKASVYFDAGTITGRPDLSGLVMNMINCWSYTESQFARILSHMLKTDFRIAVSMYELLFSSGAREAALLAAADHALSDEDKQLLQAILKVIKPSRNRRNDFSHHLWGHSPDVPDALLLIHPKVMSELNLSHKEDTLRMDSLLKEYLSDTTKFGSDMAKFHSEMLKSPPSFDFSEIQVFRKKDLQEEVELAERAYSYVSGFAHMLGSSTATDFMRQRLLKEPPIRKAVQQIISAFPRDYILDKAYPHSHIE